jgi:alpha-beta hydrolase superfamily lysophospholipase
MAYRRKEGFLKGADQNKLFFQVWENPLAQGIIIITHGQGEHSESYHRLVDYFQNDQWTFYGWDLRGHGRSEGKRGYAHSFNDYLADAKIFYQEVLQDPQVKNKPVIFLSHSMGTQIQMRSLIEDSSIKPTAQVFSAPLLGLALSIPAFKKKGSAWVAKLLPTLTLWNEIKNDDLSRDPAVIREYEGDVLRHDRLSASVFLGMLENFTFLDSAASQVTGPILVQCPETDPVVSTPAARAFFEKVASTEKVFLIYGDGAKHEMYNDLHRQEVFSDLKKFLDQFIK